MSSFTVPGKVFLLGEYSVLQGGTALLAALKPGYAFEFLPSGGDTFHPESPLGLYQKESGQIRPLTRSAQSMVPGFGGSTAELIAGVFANLERLPETKRLWAWFREHFPKASGADLVTQIEAIRTKSALFEYDKGASGALPKSSLFAYIHVFQISRDQKLATHEALKKEIPRLNIQKMNAWVTQLKKAFEENQFDGLSVFNDFANEMRILGIETDLAHEIRQSLLKIPGVFAVKGCGAGLQDTYLVACKDAQLLTEQKGAHWGGKVDYLGTLEDLAW